MTLTSARPSAEDFTSNSAHQVPTMPRCPPILKRPYSSSRNDRNDDHTSPRKPWVAYLGPLFIVVLLVMPQPSWIILLSSQYVSSSRRLLHLAVTTVLTLLAINSLAICTLRDPGRPKLDDIDSTESNHGLRNVLTVEHSDDEDEALLEDDPNDFNSSRKWCRICWAPKPDRTHHCSSCGRCVLKMDHHCPWVSQCVGHRTHAAFLHLLLCVTLLALYISINSSLVLYDFLFAPVAQPVMDSTPFHCLFLVVIGFIFAMVIGSFFGYHIYLSVTNQTTLEQLSPFILLKYLPKPKVPRHAPGTSITHSISTRNVPVPSSSNPVPTNDSPYYFPSPPPTPPPPPEAMDTLRHALLASNPLSTIPSSDSTPAHVFSSSPVATTHPNNRLPNMTTTDYAEWDEHSLSFAQRRLVRRMADRFNLWDLGWRRNIIAVLGSGDTSLRRRGHSRDADGLSLTGGLTSRQRGTTGTPNASSSRHTGRGGGGNGGGGGGGQMRAYSWRWWLSVLLNGGPPRGDGRTFPRNPKARGMLEELRRGLEEVDRRERGDSGAGEQVGIRRGRRGPGQGGPGDRGEEMELHGV
jgi:palmitoyltransferase ZDHHC2/15/20